MIDLILNKMIKYFDNDIKRINHALKVYGFASSIARMENVPTEKTFIIKSASLIHDIGIKEAEKKYGSSSGHFQEIEGPEVAKDLLSDVNIDNYLLERILYLIGNHHSYNKIDDIDFQILVEADFLVNIFEDKMSQNSTTNIRKNIFKTKTGIELLESMYL